MSRRGIDLDGDGKIDIASDSSIVEGAWLFVWSCAGIVALVLVAYHFDYKATYSVVESWFNMPPAAIAVISLLPTAMEIQMLHMPKSHQKVAAMRKLWVGGMMFAAFDWITDTVWVHGQMGNLYQVSELFGLSGLGMIGGGIIELIVSGIVGFAVALAVEFTFAGQLTNALVHAGDAWALLAVLWESIMRGFQEWSKRKARLQGVS